MNVVNHGVSVVQLPESWVVDFVCDEAKVDGPLRGVG